MSDGPPDGAALQARWNAVCDEALAEFRTVRDTVGRDDDWARRHMGFMITALERLRWVGNSQQRLPGTAPKSLSYDAPPTLSTCDELWRRARAVTDLWDSGLGAPDWDWAGRGYPPGWHTSFYDRTLGRFLVRGR